LLSGFSREELVKKNLLHLVARSIDTVITYVHERPKADIMETIIPKDQWKNINGNFGNIE
jgi:hypothetical protein